MSTEKIEKVLANVAQNLTTEEQAQARANIGAQGQLTAGSNVSITNDVISATDTTYTAGSNVSITDNVISATDTTYTAGTGIDITNNVISTTGGGGVFIATYNSTTYQQISDALANGDAVFLRYGGADIPISSSTATRHGFMQVRREGHSYAQQADSTRVFIVETDDSWQMNTVPVAYNIIAGAGLTYDINDNDLTLIVSAHFMPDLQLLQTVTVDVDSDTTLYMENGKSYYIRITGSTAPIITLSTTSITTIHSLIAVKNTSATACADVTIRFRDETGYNHDIQLMMYETSAEYDFYVDIRNLGATNGVVARVYDMPCMYRKGWQGSAQYTNDTAWIGYVR